MKRHRMGVQVLVKPLFLTSLAILSSTTLGRRADGEYNGESLPPETHVNVFEGEQTSLPCPIDLTAREPVSATWFLVGDGLRRAHAGVASSVLDNASQARKVYALVAPDPPANAVLGGTRGLVDGAHWKQPSWAGRAFLSLLSDPPALLLNGLVRADTGTYVCNVTYRSDNFTSGGETVTAARVELFVAVLLQPPVIADHDGTILNSTAGPYILGDTIQLTCRAPPVDHPLNISWWRNSEPFKSTFGTVPISGGGWENTLELGPLRREDLFANVTCASTSDISMPAATSVLLEFFLPPMEVSVWSWPYDRQEASGWVMLAAPTSTTGKVAAGLSTHEAKVEVPDSQGVARSSAEKFQEPAATGFYTPRSFECEVTGSRPQPNVTWFLDGLPLGDHLSHTLTEDNVTTSVLLLPFLEHTGKLLECRATNGNLPDGRGVLSGVLSVNISNKPEVNVRLGAGLNASYITEGADVYMECSVLAASRVTDVTWIHDERELGVEPAEGVVVTSRYLVIRHVGPVHTGSYTCRVTSTEGESVKSTPLFLRVRYPPRCASDGARTLHVEKDAAINVTCDVHADPSEPLRYFWQLENDTGAAAEEKKERSKLLLRESPQITHSERLAVIANASIFNLVLACWAENTVGMQRQRCRFKFSPKSENSGLVCSIGNYTDTSFSLTCSALLVNETSSSQRLRVEVFDAGHGNRSERSFWSRDMGPIFVNRLHPSTDYLVTVRMPTQATFHTYVRTLSPAQTLVGQGGFQKTQQRRWTLTLSIVVLTSSLASTLVTLLTGYLVCVLRKQRRKPRRPPDKKAPSDESVCVDFELPQFTERKKHCAGAEIC